MNVLARKLGLVATFCVLLTGCAQTGPPLPPSLELPKPPSDLRAVRKGNQVTLTWSVPTRTTDRQTARYFGPTLICRSLDPDMSGCRNPVAQLPPGQSTKRASGSTQDQPQVYTDTLPVTLQEQNPTGEVTYAVEVLNRDNRSAGLSNRVRVPIVPTLPPPADFAAQLTGDGVVLSWSSRGEASVPPGTMPSVLHRYRVYRREQDSGKDVSAGEISMGEEGPMRWLDSTFEWEKTYTYRINVASVARWRTSQCPPAQSDVTAFPDCISEATIDGADSPEVKVVAHDTFPPAVPAGVQAVYSGEGQKPFVDLIWAPVTDADLAGYNVYRREAEGAPVKLNSELAKSPSYRDSAVTSGKTYFYSVSAADVRGNESARTEEASESVP
jgi:hypothetical protein